MPLEFEWDEDKAATNLDKHGVDFVDAARIFAGYTVEAVDDREDYGETRRIAVGMHAEQAYVVIFTERKGRIRLISAWKAGRNDRRKYQKGLAARFGWDEKPDQG